MVSVFKLSSFNGCFDLTDGKMKYITSEHIKPTEPTAQKGSPNPPKLYRAVPIAGPENRLKVI